MEKDTVGKLKTSFLSLLAEKENLSSFEKYYASLVSWTKDNTELLGEKLTENKDINALLELDPREYITEKPELSLDMEQKRLEGVEYDSIGSFIMAVQNTLWDMVIIESDKNCPICIYAGLKYVIFENEARNIRELVLECYTCGWSEHLDGRKWEHGRVERILPANKKDLDDRMIVIPTGTFPTPPPLTYPIYLSRTPEQEFDHTIVYSFGYNPDELFAKIGVSPHTREPYGIATAETVGVEAFMVVRERLLKYFVSQPEPKYPQKIVIERDGVSGVEW